MARIKETRARGITKDPSGMTLMICPSSYRLAKFPDVGHFIALRATYSGLLEVGLPAGPASSATNLTVLSRVRSTPV